MNIAFRNLKYDELIEFCRHSLDILDPMMIKIYQLGRRGSERIFYRIRWSECDSAILIHYNPNRKENNLYADIAKFLLEINIPVPRIIGHDPKKYLILMEDIGDISIYSLRNEPWEKRKDLYEKILLIARRLHTYNKESFPFDRIRIMEDFGSNLYRWEHEYFKENFVKSFCRIDLKPDFEDGLKRELLFLEERLLRVKKSLIHRDFQSHNIMLRDGEIFLIDFQGLRFGNLFYDLGSLLYDPYVDFLNEEREELLFFYYSLTEKDMEWKIFKNHFLEASSQRLMQALGAYGFLGQKKGLKSYLKYIPSALKNLLLVTSNIPYLVLLNKLSLLCKNEIS